MQPHKAYVSCIAAPWIWLVWLPSSPAIFINNCKTFVLLDSWWNRLRGSELYLLHKVITSFNPFHMVYTLLPDLLNLKNFFISTFNLIVFGTTSSFHVPVVRYFPCSCFCFSLLLLLTHNYEKILTGDYWCQ